MAVTLDKLKKAELYIAANAGKMTAAQKAAAQEFLLQKKAEFMQSSGVQTSDIADTALKQRALEESVAQGTYKAGSSEISAKEKENTKKIEDVIQTADFIGEKLKEVEMRGPMARMNPILAEATGGQVLPKTLSYEALRKANIGPLARAISGEVGVLTDKDIARAENLLPKVTDTDVVAAEKLNNLKKLAKIKTEEQKINQKVQKIEQPKSRFKIEAVE